MKKQSGNAILTTPLLIAIGTILIAILTVTTIKILMPYIWYEKLSSTCIKYVFVIEEYGYLTKKETKLLIDQLEKEGFEREKIKLEYTSKAVNYGDEIYLKIKYDYNLKIPMIGEKTIPMQIEKYSICKR